MSQCPICRGTGVVWIGSLHDDELRTEYCPMCLGGTYSRETATATLRYLRRCEQALVAAREASKDAVLDLVSEVLR